MLENKIFHEHSHSFLASGVHGESRSREVEFSCLIPSFWRGKTPVRFSNIEPYVHYARDISK